MKLSFFKNNTKRQNPAGVIVRTAVAASVIKYSQSGERAADQTLVKPVLYCETFVAATAFPYPNPRSTVLCCNNGAITSTTHCDIVSGARETKASAKDMVHTDD